MIRTVEQWIEEYKRKNALWIHDGNRMRPHALLTSGKHSNGFFNSRLVIPDEVLLRDAASDLLESFAKQGGYNVLVDGVVGPQTGATKLAQLLIEGFDDYTPEGCFWASPAKHEENGKKSMVFNPEDIKLLPGQSILLCEDVLTTGGSVDLAASAVENAGGIVLPFILVLVNRSGLTEVGGKKIVALITRDLPIWDPTKEICSLCAIGSEAIPAKDNWDRLNAVY